MIRKLIEALNVCGFIEGQTLCLQGTMSPDIAYPDCFSTYWTDDVPDGKHFDNITASYDWHFSVIVYSNNSKMLEEKSDEARSALKAAGFIPQGKGHNTPSDDPAFTGWAMDFVITEYL